METKNRSKTAQKIIKDKLSQYLTEEQLSMLDDLGIEILADYFSNHQLREMKELQPAQVAGLVDRNQDNEVRRRLTHITEEEYESGKLLEWFKANCSEIEEVYDPQAEKVIALEVKHNELKNAPARHWDGRFIVAIGDRLASTRVRLDGVVGYQSAVEPENPDFLPTLNKFFEEREKLVEAHQKKVKAAKDKYEKAVAAAMKKHDADIEKYVEKLSAFNAKVAKLKEPPTYEEAEKLEKDRPVEPVLVMPEYTEVEPFIEPERPDVKQFLPTTDTRWADIESENIPEEHVMSSISNDDIVKVRDAIESSGYKKPVKKVKDGYQVDKFILRKVK